MATIQTTRIPIGQKAFGRRDNLLKPLAQNQSYDFSKFISTIELLITYVREEDLEMSIFVLLELEKKGWTLFLNEYNIDTIKSALQGQLGGGVDNIFACFRNRVVPYNNLERTLETQDLNPIYGMEIRGVKIAWPEPPNPVETNPKVINAKTVLNKACMELFEAIDAVEKCEQVFLLAVEKMQVAYQEIDDATNTTSLVSRLRRAFGHDKVDFLQSQAYHLYKQSLEKDEDRIVAIRILQTREIAYVNALKEYHKSIEGAAKTQKEMPFFDALRTLPYDILELISKNLFRNEIVRTFDLNNTSYIFSNTKNDGEEYQFSTTVEKIEDYLKDDKSDWTRSTVQLAMADLKNNGLVWTGNHPSFVDIPSMIVASNKVTEAKTKLLGDFNANFLEYYMNPEDFYTNVKFLAILESIHRQIDFLKSNKGYFITTSIEIVNIMMSDTFEKHLFDFNMFIKDGKMLVVDCLSRSDGNLWTFRNQKYKQKTADLTKNLDDIKQKICRYYLANFMNDAYNVNTRSAGFRNIYFRIVKDKDSVGVGSGGGGGNIGRLYRKYCVV